MPETSRWLRRSPHDVARTLDRLEQAVLRHGGVVRFARIDHAAIARSAGGTSRAAETLQMENPALVARLLSIDPALAWSLPIKLLAWEDSTGQVWLRITEPAAIAAEGMPASPPVQEIIRTIEEILGGWVDEAVGAA